MAPDHELLVAAIAALKADAAVAALVGDRIFERPPDKPAPAYPYVAAGPTSSTPDDADCVDAEEISIQFDIWSIGGREAFSGAEARKIADAIKRVLHHSELSLPTNALVSLELVLKRTGRDPDGVTNHGIVQFTAIVETP